MMASKHCNTHCNTLQHTATLVNSWMMAHTATDCNTLQHRSIAYHMDDGKQALQHTLQHTATHCNTHCNTLQLTATHCNTGQSRTTWMMASSFSSEARAIGLGRSAGKVFTCMCCCVLQRVALWEGNRFWRQEWGRCLRVCVAVCCSVLQCVIVCCSVLQCVAVCGIV